MEIKDFCGAMESELTSWKAKMYDVVRKVDKLGTAERGKIRSNVEDLHMLIEEMASRIDELRIECPTEWKAYRKQMDTAHTDMRKKYLETLEFIGKASPVSVPG